MNDPLKQFLDSLSKEQLRAWQEIQDEEDENGLGLLPILNLAAMVLCFVAAFSEGLSSSQGWFFLILAGLNLFFFLIRD